MTNEETIDAWVDAVTAHNHGKAGAWTARFELDGKQLIEDAVKRLDAIGATMTSNGGPRQFVAAFPGSSAREVASVLVDQGAWICSDQTLAPVP